MIVNGPDNKQYDIPDDATDSEILGLFGGGAAPSKPQATKSNGFAGLDTISAHSPTRFKNSASRQEIMGIASPAARAQAQQVKKPLRAFAESIPVGAAKIADTAAALVGSLAEDKENSLATKIQRNITEPAIQYWNEQKTPSPLPTIGENVGASLGELAPTMALGPAALPVMAATSTYQTGKDLVDAGISLEAAQKASMLQGGGAAAMGAIPGAAPTVGKTALLALANPVTGIAQRAATREFLKPYNKEVAEGFDPLDPASLIMDVAMAGPGIMSHFPMKAEAKAKAEALSRPADPFVKPTEPTMAAPDTTQPPKTDFTQPQSEQQSAQPKAEPVQPEPPAQPSSAPLEYTSNNVPVDPNRVNFEVGLVKNPNTSKTAVLLPPETTGPQALQIAKNAGLRALKQGEELYLFDPKQISEYTLRKQVKEGKNGLALGYGTESVPENGIPYAVDLNGHGTLDINEIISLRDASRLGFSGVAPDVQSAITKIQEMGRSDAEIRGVPLDTIDQKGDPALDTEPRETEVAPYEKTLYRGEADREALHAGGMGRGKYYTSEESIAKSYAEDFSDVPGQVKSEAVKLEKPFYAETLDDVFAVLSESEQNIFTPNEGESIEDLGQRQQDRITEILKSQGYDGIVLKTSLDPRTNEYVSADEVVVFDKGGDTNGKEKGWQRREVLGEVTPDAPRMAESVPGAETFNRLSPNGKRGSAEAFTVNISPSKLQSLAEIRQEISDGEAGKRIATNMEQNDTGPKEQVSWGSTFPEYFQNKNLTKKQVLPVLDRILKGESVTEVQWLMAEDMLQAKRYDTLNKILSDRAKKYAESETSISNVSDEDLARANQMADDFFAQFGGDNETTASVAGDVRQDATRETDGSAATSGGKARVGEAATTERIDESGWGQQVAPEIQGDKKPLQFGDKKPTGRNVGLSEFTDGFTTDPQQDIFSAPSSGGKSYADTGGYAERTPPIRETTQTFIEMPEMLKLAKMINDGKLPKLVERMGKALGRFIGDGDGNALIKLRKDLFAGPQIASESFKSKDAMGEWEEWQQAVKNDNPDADIIFRQKYNKNTGNVDFKAYKRDPNFVAKIFAHEIGHNVDYLPDSMVNGRGNILGHIAALKRYMKDTLAMYPNAKGEALTKADKERLAAQAKADINAHAGEDIVETITREVPKYADAGVTPEMITEIWNGMDSAREKNPDLYKFIAKMSDSEKKQVVVQAMKGVVHESLKRLGRVQVGTETITETVTRKATVSPEAIKRRAEQLIKEEIMKRRLYEKDVVMDELKALTQAWKPFDDTANAKYTKYRYSPAELYADATSVLFNEPQLLKDTAPTFYKSYFYYMGERPQFQEAYKAISRLSKDPQELGKVRLQDRFDMYDRGDEKYNEIRNSKADSQSIKDTFYEIFSDANHHTKQLLKGGPEGDLAINRLEAMAYIPGEVSNYFLDQNNIRKEYQSVGVTDNQFGAYLDLKHIIDHRTAISNSLFTTEASAKTELQALRDMVGEKGYAEIERLAEKFYDTRSKLIDTFFENGLLTQAEYDDFKAKRNYVRNQSQIYLDKRYGGKGSAEQAGWKKMAEGMVDDKVNAYIATVLQDMSILRMGRINVAKLAAIDNLAPKGAAPLADKKFVGGRRQPVDPPDGYKNMLVLREGKPEYRVVSDFVHKTYTYELGKARQINRVWGAIQSVYKNLFISKNVPWMVRNMMFRDPAATFKNNPEFSVFSLKDRINIYKELFKAIPEVFDDVANGVRSEELREMYGGNMLNVERVYAEKDTSWQNELDRMAFEFAQGKSPSQNKIIAQVKAVNKWINHLGHVSDKAPKLAGKRLLEAKGLSGEVLAEKVRNSVGTPDFQVQSGGHKVFNYLGMFYEVRKASIRTMAQAFKRDPFEYIAKTISMNILPKLMRRAAVMGLLGPAIKEAYDKIQKWDLAFYNTIPLPTFVIDWLKEKGMIGKDAGAYFKLPQDYEGQFFGAVAQHLIEQDGTAILNDLYTAQPLSPHAFWGNLWNIGQYVTGGMPYDTFRQKPVLTKEQQEYTRIHGPWNAKGMAGMGKYLYNSTLGSALPKMDTKEFPTKQTTFEKTFGMTPGLSSIIVVSDGASRQTLRESIQEGRDKEVIKSYEVGDVINEAIRAGKNKPSDMVGVYKSLVAEGKVDPVKTKFGAFRSRYMKSLAQEKYGIKPQSKKEEAVLKRGFEQSE